MLTFSEARGLYKLYSINSKLNFGFERIPYLQKLHIFCGTLNEIPRHYSADGIESDDQRYYLKQMYPKYGVYYT